MEVTTCTRICLWISIGVIFSQICSFGHPSETKRNDECELTEPELNHEMSEITNQFGNTFDEVGVEINKLESNKGNNKISAIILVGNTGAGKSTLAQLISGDNTKLKSVEMYPDSGDYIISDDDKIGTETIISKTLYPNLLIDNETGIFICDSPGFKDTRSPVHELIAASSMKKVTDKMKNVKIVLVVTHTSLKKGSYRDDFTNLLKQTVDFVKDVEKYKDSFYLVATKAENSYIYTKNKFVLLSDETIINGIYNFLNDTRLSLESSATSLANSKQTFDVIKIIEYLMQRNDDIVPSKVKIFRKPLTDGSIQENDLIQIERTALRKMLLRSNDFTLKNDDFGYSISASAKLYVNEIVSFSNKYMISLSSHITKYLMEYYKNTLKDIDDVSRRLKSLNVIKSDIIQLGHDLGVRLRPFDFVEKIEEFSELNDIRYSCNLNFNNVSVLNNYLTYLEQFSNLTSTSERSWNSSFKSVTDFISNEMDNYNLLEEVMLILSSYNFQKKKYSLVPILEQWGKDDEFKKTINEKSVLPFLKNIGVNDRYSTLKPNNYTMEALNRAVSLLIKSELKIKCEDMTLRIEGYIVRLSDVKYSDLKTCIGLKNVIIFAMHTLFIDRDLNEEELAGKQLFIVAPTWHTVGTRRISVDGKSERNVFLPKSATGEVGQNGKNGRNGGIVTGIGRTFENGDNLFISANGGHGQDGQDGGDGINGFDGHDGVFYSRRKSGKDRSIYVVYNTVDEVDVFEGSPGTTGGDSGAGGLGGRPGKRGTVNLLVYGQNNSVGVSIETKDGVRGKDGKNGEPGIGGMGGCTTIRRTRQHYALFIPVASNTDTSRGECLGRSRSGHVKGKIYFEFTDLVPINLEPLNKCSVLSDYISAYKNYYEFKQFNEFTNNFALGTLLLSSC